MGENLDYIFDNLLDNAKYQFSKSSEGMLLEEKLERIHNDCKVMLSKSEYEFVYECFDTITHIQNVQSNYLYRYGMRDCIAILKVMGVIG